MPCCRVKSEEMLCAGKGMSARLENNLKRGLQEQSRMVHLDSFHQGEVGHAAMEDDLWRNSGVGAPLQWIHA